MFGGGTEVWVTPKVALFGELSFTQIKGKAEDGGEGLDRRSPRFLGFGVQDPAVALVRRELSRAG